MGLVKETLLRLQEFQESFTPVLNKIVLFFVILFLGFLLGKILGRLVRKLLSDIKTDEGVQKLFGIRVAAAKALGTLVSFAVYLVSLYFALTVIGLMNLALLVLVAVFVLTLLLSTLLMFSEIMPNLAAWLKLRKKARIKEGAFIRMEKVEGTITEIGLFDTEIETKGGDILLVPNALFLSKEVRVMKRKPEPKEEKKEEKKDEKNGGEKP